MLADAELEYQENSEAVQKETERVLRAIRGGSMTDLYSSTVPPAVLQKLRSTAPTSGWPRDAWIAEQAAQWGADQELDACCEWLEQNQGRWEIPMALRDARRPKPPSLKEQAFKDLDELLRIARQAGVFNPPDNIRRALEALPE
jgi:hypothetical protein